MANTSLDFTTETRNILDMAIKEAKRLKQDIGPEHILLALISNGESTAVKALSDIGVTPVKVRVATEYIIGYGDRSPDQIRLTPRAKKVLEIAQDEARKENKQCGAEHLLLGILLQHESIAAEVLESIAGLDKLREYIRTIESVK